MSDNKFIISSFSHFFNYHPLRLILLFLITLFLGLTQGVTIIMLIPLLGLLNPDQATGETSRLNDFFNKIIENTGIELNLTLILAFFAVSLLITSLLQYFQTTMQSTYQQEFSYHTRRRLFKKIIKSDWQFLNSKSKHNHIQILTTEIPKMTNYYYFYLGLATKVILISSQVIMAFLISVKFSLFVVVTGIVIFFLLRGYIKNSSLIGGANIQAFRKMLKHIDDFWVTVKMAKVHNTEDFYFNKFDDSNKRILEYQNKQIKNRALPQLLFTMAGVVVLIAVVYFAYNSAHIPLASLFVLILLFARIFPQFTGINNDVNMMYSGAESVKLVLNLDRETKESFLSVPKDISTISFNDKLEIKNISFSYDKVHPVYENFSVSIPAGKMTGITGRSGCGKTTLIDIIAGLQLPDSGSVEVDGITLSNENFPAWRRSLGYLPQDSFFIDGTIRENLIWDSERKLTDEQIFETLKIVNADTIVTAQKEGLDTNISNYQFHFSGGERQRLALARVLLRAPKLLLLDEATSSLDSENEKLIMECLTRLKKNVTVVFVTHRLYLREWFDEMVEMESKDFC